MSALSDRSLRLMLEYGKLAVERLADRAIQPDEEWRPVPGYEGRYEVSSFGNVRSIGTGGNGRVGQPLKPMRASPALKYVQVALYRDGQSRYYRIHQLVCSAFLGPPPDGYEINHIDGDASNNRRENLEYVTRGENIHHSYALGLRTVGGEHNPAAKLTRANVEEIRRRFHAGESKGCDLAVEFGVSTSAISFVVTGATWKDGHGTQ